MNDLSGTVLDNHYKLMSIIGSGATSTVYLAQDLNIGAIWAVKVIDKHNPIQKDDFDRQKAEAMLLSELSHPVFPRVLPTIYDKEDALYIVMDFVSGITLRERMKQPASITEIVEWLKQLCDGIEYLHSKGYVYADLKPENIIINENKVMLIDVGACVKKDDVRSLRTGNKLFSAPEYKNGSPVPAGDYTDNYSIGKIGLFMVEVQQYEDMPEDLITILNKCSDYDYRKRYKSTREILEQLRKFEKRNDPNTGYRIRLGIFLTCALLCIASFITGIIAYYNCRITYKQDYEVYINQAIKYEQSGDIEDAVEAYLNAIIKNPDNPDVYQKVFELLQPKTSDNVDEKNRLLLDAFRERTEVNKLSDTLRVDLAELCIEQESPVYIDYASELLKGLKGERENIIREMIDGKGNNDQIIDKLNQMIEMTTDDHEKIRNLYLLTCVLSQQNEWEEEQIKKIEKEIDGLENSIKENDIKVLQIYKRIALGLSQDLSNAEQRAEAVRWWEKLSAWQTSFSKEDFICEGNLFLTIGDNERALDCFQNAISRDQTDIVNYFYAIDAALKGNKNDVAIQLWNSVQSLKNQQEGKLSANVINQMNAIETQMKMSGAL